MVYSTEDRLSDFQEFNRDNYIKPCPSNDGTCTQPGCPIGRCCNGKPPNEIGGVLTCQKGDAENDEGNCTNEEDVLGFCCDGKQPKMLGEYAICPSIRNDNKPPNKRAPKKKQPKKEDKPVKKEDKPVKKEDKPVKKEDEPVKKEDKPVKKEDKCTLIGITLSSTEWLIIIIISVVLLCIAVVLVYNMLSSSSNVGTNVVSNPNRITIPLKPKFKRNTMFKKKAKPKKRKAKPKSK
tara:strand:- start:314 stop:1021 length:708 start_codon:yes stop_codon:yes gene_type:complete